MIVVQRRRQLPDGRVEVFLPMANKHGQYVLADRVVDPQHNKAVNQFFVDSIEALAARVRRGGVSVRMRGNLTGQPNLISAAEIEVIDDGEEDGDVGDPFAAFDDWASESDDKAYADL
jgi:hypothetical protein